MSHTADDRSHDSDNGARVGYTRVSTVAQTLDQQSAALSTVGVARTFSDTMSEPATTDRAWPHSSITSVRATPWWCGN
jgi:hypothetical protein